MDKRKMTYQIINGDALTVLKELPSNSIDCCVTSPPYYGLRDYQVNGQIGLEDTPEMYIEKLVNVFCEVKRVLKNEGTLWINIGDSYVGSNKGSANQPNQNKGNSSSATIRIKQKNMNKKYKPKDLIGIPWMLAFALRDKLGLYLRNDIIWHKPNPMPESVKDRCTKSHEYIFLFSKSKKYYFDNEIIKEPATQVHDKRLGYGRLHYRGKRQNIEGKAQSNFVKIVEKRNKRDVWSVCPKPYKEAHFATFPPNLILPCILAGCQKEGIVLDPFCGSGTTGEVAFKNNRNFIGIDLNSDYCELSKNRILRSQKENVT